MDVEYSNFLKLFLSQIQHKVGRLGCLKYVYRIKTKIHIRLIIDIT